MMRGEIEDEKKGRRIAVVTATRAEYGLLSPLIRRINEDDELELMLLVTGGHLSEKQGMTIQEIENDGFPVAYRIPILEDDNTPYGVSVTMASAIRSFAACFRDDRPDMVVILGDRTEMLGVASAAVNERIPIAHICGGEVTEGAVDDCIRHALTKMSYLHFTETEDYRKRVIQMGEARERVYNVGSMGVENILHVQLLDENSIRRELGIPNQTPYVITTFHPETMENTIEAGRQAKELCKAISEVNDYYYIVTGANADTGGEIINQIMQEFSRKNENVKWIMSLGRFRYLSAVKNAAFVLGNSSSGMIEAPILGTPTINVGNRQKGRLVADTIINSASKAEDIVKAIQKVGEIVRKPTALYGDGHTSERITEIIKRQLSSDCINLKKGFCDIDSHINATKGRKG